MQATSRNEKTTNAISKIINNKVYIGSYVGLKNSDKKAEVKVYTNKNGKSFHFVMDIYQIDGIEYYQGVLSNAYSLDSLSQSLGNPYEALRNQKALTEYWKDQGVILDNVLTVGF